MTSSSTSAWQSTSKRHQHAGGRPVGWPHVDWMSGAETALLPNAIMVPAARPPTSNARGTFRRSGHHNNPLVAPTMTATSTT